MQHACVLCLVPFEITDDDLAFYEHISPVFNGKKERNPRKLWKRPCMKCRKEMETTYAPERSETVYCKECYLKGVY